MNIFEELKWRGLVADCTDANVVVEGGRVSEDNSGLWHRQNMVLYAGFDPTADSLHVGNLVPLLALRRFQLLGHHPIALAGGATGSIGDPSGKTAERQLLTKEILDHNIASVKLQLAKLLDFDTKQNPARLLDNATWTTPVGFLDFLRDIGKHFSVNQMIAKESVRARMEDREVGISYTEFSYMLLQAFDFMVLNRDHNCELQIGGSDQWGTITAGIELTRKKLGRQVFGLTLPLITNADGSKFGKSVSGAIWLDPKRTSGYRFYQFWINTDDRDVIRYLKYFTFLSQEEIVALEKQHTENPGVRVAHKALAKAATDLIHGEQATEDAINTSQAFFTGSVAELPPQSILEARQELPGPVVDPSQLPLNKSLIEVVVYSGLAPSKGQAKRDIESGGIYLNDKQEKDPSRIVTEADYLLKQHLILRKGKKNYAMISGSAPISNNSNYLPPSSVD